MVEEKFGGGNRRMIEVRDQMRVKQALSDSSHPPSYLIIYPIESTNGMPPYFLSPSSFSMHTIESTHALYCIGGKREISRLPVLFDDGNALHYFEITLYAKQVSSDFLHSDAPLHTALCFDRLFPFKKRC